MPNQSRPYAIHSDSECERLERQAALAGLENHLRHVPVPETAHILDAGCGSGAMTRCFGSRYADASVVGVDIRDEYVSFAQSRANEDGLRNVEFRQGSVFNLPFANASFDVVWSKYVMQWINEPERAVAEFRRVTKPGGVVVCCILMASRLHTIQRTKRCSAKSLRYFRGSSTSISVERRHPFFIHAA